MLDEDDIASFTFVLQLVIWFYSNVTNFMSLIINKVKNCQNQKMKKKRYKVKSKNFLQKKKKKVNQRKENKMKKNKQ